MHSQLVSTYSFLSIFDRERFFMLGCQIAELRNNIRIPNVCIHWPVRFIEVSN